MPTGKTFRPTPRLAASALALLLLCGCAEQALKGLEYQQAPLPPPTYGSPAMIDRAIRPLDSIALRVDGAEALSTTTQVSGDGTAMMPLLGAVDVSGMTERELERRLASLYGNRYLENPVVDVIVEPAYQRTITVDGSVVQPGSLEWRPDSSLQRAVAQAGGITQTGNAERVAVVRNIGGARHIALFDLGAIRSGQMIDPQLYPEDIVVVDGSATKSLYRDVLTALPIFAIFTRF